MSLTFCLQLKNLLSVTQTYNRTISAMVKYLFTDGEDGVKEVQSAEELQLLVDESRNPSAIRVWVFNTNEWISYPNFKKVPLPVKKSTAKHSVQPVSWMKKFLVFSVAGVALFLVYNFTKINWEKASPIAISAQRPSNMPVMDMDSLIWELEQGRTERLDKTTRNNLRLRNTWPDKLLLQVKADRDTSSIGSILYNIEISIDNATGQLIDDVVVRFNAWRNGQLHSTDTLVFNNLDYIQAEKRKLTESIKADSMNVYFETIRAKSFNFCYSSDKPHNNSIDRWFCTDQNE